MFSQDCLEPELHVIEERLIALRRQALKNGQCLLLNEKESELFVGDVIRRHRIDKNMVAHFLRDAKILRKYKGQSPRSLLDLVTMLGGFKKALREVREATLFSQTWGYENYKDYLAHLSEILQLCRTHAFNRTTNKLNPTLECSLCWRAVKPGSAQYVQRIKKTKCFDRETSAAFFQLLLLEMTNIQRSLNKD